MSDRPRDAAHGEKVRQGQDRARAAGVRIGRPRNRELTPDVLRRARVLLDSGMSLRDVAREVRVPKSTLHRELLGTSGTTPDAQ